MKVKKASQVFVVGFGLLVLVPGAKAESKTSWQGKMQSLGEAIGELLPEIVSKKGNVEVIEKNAKALSELSHTLKPGLATGKMAPPEDADPSLAIIAGKFSDQTKYAYRAVKAGNVDYGKNILRGVTSYCIACHTRHDKGPEFPTFPLSPKADQLAPEEKAELFIATRQFDKGIDAFEGLIKDPAYAKSHPFEWERAVRSALAIAIRVKNDPARAQQVIDLALKTDNVPAYTKSYLTKWKAAIADWKSQGKKAGGGEKELAADMRKLMAEAKAGQLFPADHSSEIQYLRASGVAHDLLRQAKTPKVKAEGLLMVGTAYEVLGNPVLWPMHELYFEACVRQVPHSKLAQQCYDRYEESVYMGYTGSAGTNIPDDIRVQLAELKQLAQ
jgi:hypothetical protein